MMEENQLQQHILLNENIHK